MRCLQGPILALALTLLAGPLAAGEALDQHGEPQPWKGSADAYTVIDFAADWCAPCHKTLPKLQRLAERHPRVRFIVVSVDEKASGRDHLVKGVGLTLPVLWDSDHRIAEHYAPQGMPATFVLDPQGEVIHRHVGSREDDWRAFEELIAGLGEG